MIRNYKYSIIHEEEDYIIVNKPPHIAVIPERDNTVSRSLKELLEIKYGKLYVVHRLDKNTSGLIIFCKNADTHKAFSMLFQNREIHKYYHAIVYGRPMEEEGVIDARISGVPNSKGKYYVSKQGKEAISHYKLVETLLGNYSLLEMKIITGRTHQIRVHCQHMGFPLAVDSMYGYLPDFFLSSIKRNFRLSKFEEEMPLMSRTSLHARRIEFVDPITCEERSFTAPHFKDFKAMLNQLNDFGVSF